MSEAVDVPKMRILSYIILTIVWDVALGLSPPAAANTIRNGLCLPLSYSQQIPSCGGMSQDRRRKKVIRSMQSRPGTRLYAASDEGGSAVAALLQMVDTIASAQTSTDKIHKMEELEETLSRLVEEEKGRAFAPQVVAPQPPNTPPPMRALDEDELQKAISALANLRVRLAEEEESLLQAEFALRQSRDEEETLRQAEEALQRERARAAQRKEETLRKTHAFLQSAKEARKKAEELKRQAPPLPQGAAGPRSNSRPTIALDPFNASGGASSRLERAPPVINSQLPLGVPCDAAPEGVPILFNWKVNPDGTVTGNVKGSPMFREGAIVTTSILATRGESGTVVSTTSGSK